MPLGTTLRLLSMARGLNAADIATAIPRAGAATVSAWLRGEKLPGMDQLDALARTFGVPAGALLSELASTLDPTRTAGEHDLLAAYRALDARRQATLLDVAAAMAGHPASTASARTPAASAARAPGTRTASARPSASSKPGNREPGNRQPGRRKPARKASTRGTGA